MLSLANFVFCFGAFMISVNGRENALFLRISPQGIERALLDFAMKLERAHPSGATAASFTEMF